MSNTQSKSELLECWGFSKFAQAFIENEVDLTSLPLLDDDQIKQLIPPIGPQAKFKKCLLDWKSTSSEIDGGIQNLIKLYGEGVDELSPSSPIDTVRSSPSSTFSTLSSPVYSVQSSPSSTLSCAEELNNKYQDLTTLLNRTPEGKLLLEQRLYPLGINYEEL